MKHAAEIVQVAARKAWNEAFGPFPARYAPMLHRALEAAVEAAIEAYKHAHDEGDQLQGDGE